MSTWDNFIDSLLNTAEAINAYPGVQMALRVAAILVIGYPLLRLLINRMRRFLQRRTTPQLSMVVTKVVYYVGMVAMLAVILTELGFTITAVIGAAGILGVALGFASQTSLSNIISGFFLMGERPFAVGEVIQIGDIIGTVMTIDLLSVKVRTPDNRFIRIPNEQLIKGTITTINRYPIRRLDVRLSVAYKEDVARVRAVLADIANDNPLCLDEPKPLIIFDKFGDSGLEFLFAVWVVRERFLEVKNGIMDTVKARFDAEGIEIPFPHMSLYAGAATGPMPIRIVNDPAPLAGEGDLRP